MWIDSHCHLNHENIKPLGHPTDLIEAAREDGISGMVTICCRIAEEFPEILAIARHHDNVWCSIGTHPHEASNPKEKSITQEELETLALSDPKVIGIGETGLDYHYDYSSREDQHKSFRKHIRACLNTDMPMIVHAREADEDIMHVIREETAGQKLNAVLHCFSSGQKMAEQGLEMGFYISYSGIVTFKNATELQDIARITPLERILVETDAPFLAPTPLRGKVNQPAYTAHTGEFLAGLLDADPSDLAKQTTENFFRLFPRAANTFKEVL
jgi:TatD DNase family protein